MGPLTDESIPAHEEHTNGRRATMLAAWSLEKKPPNNPGKFRGLAAILLSPDLQEHDKASSSTKR